MNEEIINKLLNSKSQDDNLLGLEFIFKKFINSEEEILGFSNNGKKKRFIKMVKKDLEAPFISKIHIGAWFWARYKEYLKSQ